MKMSFLHLSILFESLRTMVFRTCTHTFFHTCTKLFFSFVFSSLHTRMTHTRRKNSMQRQQWMVIKSNKQFPKKMITRKMQYILQMSLDIYLFIRKWSQHIFSKFYNLQINIPRFVCEIILIITAQYIRYIIACRLVVSPQIINITPHGYSTARFY